MVTPRETQGNDCPALQSSQRQANCSSKMEVEVAPISHFNSSNVDAVERYLARVTKHHASTIWKQELLERNEFISIAWRETVASFGTL